MPFFFLLALKPFFALKSLLVLLVELCVWLRLDLSLVLLRRLPLLLGLPFPLALLSCQT